MAVNRSRGTSVTLHFQLKPHDAVTFRVLLLSSLINKKHYMTYFLEFCDADDQRLKAPCADRLESKSPIPIVPSIGDTILIDQQHFTVVHRQVTYNAEDTTVICYCGTSHEEDIRNRCGQSSDLSEPDP